jgi:hypothetical protein
VGQALDVCSGNIFGHFSYYHVVNLHILISETINDLNSGFKKQIDPSESEFVPYKAKKPFDYADTTPGRLICVFITYLKE